MTIKLCRVSKGRMERRGEYSRFEEEERGKEEDRGEERRALKVYMKDKQSTGMMYGNQKYF